MEPIRSQSNRLAWKLFWAFLIISLFPIVVMLVLAFVFSGEQLLGMPAYLQQRLVIAFIALTLTTIGLVWLVTARLGLRMSTLARIVRLSAQGRPTETAAIGGNDEIAETAQWFNRMADQIAHQQALLMSQDNEENSTRRQAAALVAQQALMAGSLDDLMRSAIDLFLRHFGCSYGALYLLESKELASKIHVTLAYTAGTLGEDAQVIAKRYNEKRINLDQVPTMDWMVGRALGSRRPQVGPADANATIYEAVLPLIQPSTDGPRVIGAVDLISTSRVSDARVGPFSVRTVAEMQGIANVLALAIGSFTTATAIRDGALPTHPSASQSGQRLGSTRLDVESIYAAGSQVALAQTVDQALDTLRAALRNAPFASAILIRPFEAKEPSSLRSNLAVEVNQPESAASMHVVICRALRTQPPGMNEPPLVLPSPRLTPMEAFFQNRLEQDNRHDSGAARPTPMPLMLYDLDMQEEGAPIGDTPPELISIARRMGCRSAAYLPSMLDGHLNALLLVGASPETAAPLFRPEVLEPFQNLVHLAASALERIYTASFTQRKLTEMETLWQFTQAVSVETNLNVLLRLLHHQIEHVMGALDSFAVGLYDAETNTVQIPYMIEGEKLLDIPPFPLGAGLSSEVIRSRKPLLLSTAEEVQSLSVTSGSMLVGEEPRSWLGAPMIYAGEVVGLIIVQDTVQEGRFNASDAQLLSTLAAQVAVVVRNARLLEASRRQARQERLVNEISGRIRRAADMQSILRTTTQELAQALGARRASIRISLDASGQAAEPDAAIIDPGQRTHLQVDSPADAVPVLPIQREITKPDPYRGHHLPDDTPVLEIPLVPPPTPDEPAPAPQMDEALTPAAPPSDAQPLGDRTGLLAKRPAVEPVGQPKPKPEPAPQPVVKTPGEEQKSPTLPPASPQPASALSPTGSPSQVNSPPPTGPLPASAPAPSRPRTNPSAAFTLDLKSKPRGDAINPPTGPRVSPFIEPEPANPTPDAGSTGNSAKGEPRSASEILKRPDQRPISFDEKNRLQNANTQPLKDPNAPHDRGANTADEGKAGE